MKERIDIDDVPIWNCVTENSDQEDLREEIQRNRFSPFVIKSKKMYSEKFKYQMVKAVSMVNKGASIQEAASRIFDSNNPALFEVIKEYLENEK